MVKSIGLMGLAGSGKDTTAGILIPALHKAGLGDFETYAFASPLKDFTIDTFGMCYGDAYDNKMKELPFKKRYNYSTFETDFYEALGAVIGQYAEHRGLDAFSTYCKLVDAHAPRTLLQVYLDVLKEETCGTGWLTRTMDTLLRREKQIRFNTTPRGILQKTGTEFFRQNVTQTFWTDVAPTDKVIYTDVRFANELDYVHANGGLVVKIVNTNQRIIKNFTHSSEELVYNAKADYELQHDGVNIHTVHEAVSTFIAGLNH